MGSHYVMLCIVYTMESMFMGRTDVRGLFCGLDLRDYCDNVTVCMYHWTGAATALQNSVISIHRLRLGIRVSIVDN